MKNSFMGQLRVKVAHEKLLYMFQLEMQEKILYKSVKSLIFLRQIEHSDKGRGEKLEKTIDVAEIKMIF